LRFCRTCYSTMGDEEEVCHSCGTRRQGSSSSTVLSKKTTPPLRVATKQAPPIATAEFEKPTETTSGELSSRIVLSRRIIERVVVPALLLAILAVKLWLSLQFRLAIWDGYSYLANAHAFLLGRAPNPYHFFELFRPPFLPYIISLIWRVTGENYDVATLVQPTFTVAAGYVLFLLLKEMFDLKCAVVASLLLSIAPTVFYWTNQILEGGIAMFFLTLAMYLLWLGIERNERFLPFSAAALALGTLSRYTTLVLLPVFPIMLLVLWMAYRKTRRFPWTSFALMIIVFFLLWAPWFYWNYLYEGSPFASLISASFYEATGPTGPWYFYIVNVPDFLTIPGSILLFVGLADKRTISDRKRLVLLLWLVTLFAFHTLLVHKEERYSIEWTPALAAFAGLGFSRIEAHLPSRTKILAWLVVALWLTASFYPAVTYSVSAAKNQVLSYGSVDEFTSLSNWITTNTNSMTRGATDIPTALAYQTDRYYYNIWVLAGMAQNQGVTTDHFLSTINVTLIVVSPATSQTLGFQNDPNLALVKQFPNYDIYLYRCLNCTQHA